MGASQTQLRRVKRSLASFSLKPYHGCLLVLHGMGKLLPLDLPFRLTSTRYCFLRQILGCWRRKFTSSRNRTNMWHFKDTIQKKLSTWIVKEIRKYIGICNIYFLLFSVTILTEITLVDISFSNVLAKFEKAHAHQSLDREGPFGNIIY
jgi:hypothetical protein